MKKRLMSLIGRLADSWSVPLRTYLNLEGVFEAMKQMEDSALKAGRNPKSSVKIRNI